MAASLLFVEEEANEGDLRPLRKAVAQQGKLLVQGDERVLPQFWDRLREPGGLGDLRLDVGLSMICDKVGERR